MKNFCNKIVSSKYQLNSLTVLHWDISLITADFKIQNVIINHTLIKKKITEVIDFYSWSVALLLSNYKNHDGSIFNHLAVYTTSWICVNDESMNI